MCYGTYQSSWNDQYLSVEITWFSLWFSCKKYMSNFKPKWKFEVFVWSMNNATITVIPKVQTSLAVVSKCQRGCYTFGANYPPAAKFVLYLLLSGK